MTQLQIRAVKQAELPELLALYQHLNPDDRPLSIDRHLETHWENIYSNPLLHYLVGELDNKIVSSCTLAIIPNLTRGARPYGLIENVVTHADYRGRGLAGQVLKQALQMAWEQNCYKVMLLTSSKEETTLRFYEKNGFKRNIKTGFVAYSELA